MLQAVQKEEPHGYVALKRLCDQRDYLCEQPSIAREETGNEGGIITIGTTNALVEHSRNGTGYPGVRPELSALLLFGLARINNKAVAMMFKSSLCSILADVL
jgi:hypothetical protein